MKLARAAQALFHFSCTFALSVSLGISTPAQTSTPAEMRTSRALDIARANPLDLHAFLVDMPKGTDLHSHLSGAVYAESWIRAAAEDQLCVDPKALAFAKPEHKS